MTDPKPQSTVASRVHPFRSRALQPFVATVQTPIDSFGYVRSGDLLLLACWVGGPPAPRIGDDVLAVLVDRSRPSAPLLCRSCPETRPHG